MADDSGRGGRLTGKVATVTGAGQGLGRGIAVVLAREGAAVCVSGRTLAKVERVAAQIQEEGGQVLAVRCDVADRSDVDAMVAATVERFGTVDIVINNAQGGELGTSHPTAEVSDEVVLEMFRTGALGTLHVMQACFPLLRVGGGVVVNFGSTVGVAGEPRMAAYAMAKEAIRTLTRVTAREWGRHGIRVNAICPAGLSPAAEVYREESPERWQRILKAIPLGRMGDAEQDIGRAVVALVSDDMGYLTGATLMVDGGQYVLH